MARTRYVYDFDEPSDGGRELLGGKGIGLAEMTQLDVPVPADYDSGDGRSELAVYRAGTWWILNLSSNQVNIIQFGLSTDIPLPADYDGDGRADFAIDVAGGLAQGDAPLVFVGYGIQAPEYGWDDFVKAVKYDRRYIFLMPVKTTGQAVPRRLSCLTAGASSS